MGNTTRSATISLSTMMFLEFFIWGAWYVTVGNYMAANGMDGGIGWAYTVGPIAAIVSPFFLGMIADRFFSSERVLAVMQIIGGFAMFGAAVAGNQQNQNLFLLMLLIHMLAYMPTLGLTNTVAFHALTNSEKQFPIIRVFGTIGWIAANWVVSGWLHADKLAAQFWVTGVACIVMGIFSFFLPHTPPPAKGKPISVRDILGLDSLSLMRSRSFAVFVISSFLICIPLSFYYAFAPVFVDAVGFKDPGFTMSFGQVSEIVFMLLMPLFFLRLGVKYMLVLGMLAWVARYGLFAGAHGGSSLALGLVVVGILLHGVCYDFFFVTGFIYTDKKAPATIRAQAQGLLVLVTQGLGMFIGAVIAQTLRDRNTPAAATALYKQAADLSKQAQSLTESAAKPLIDQANSLSHQANALIQWQSVWLFPCLAALAVVVLFFVLFKDDTKDATASVPSIEPTEASAA